MLLSKRKFRNYMDVNYKLYYDMVITDFYFEMTIVSSIYLSLYICTCCVWL